MKNKLIAILFVACMTLSVTACGSSTEADTPNSQQTENESQANDNYADLNTENDSIELIAGEQGEYGTLITMSEGTDMEESFYVYYVPAGTYTVTNEGEYMTQVNVYEGFARNNETGYDEYTATGDIKLIDSGETATIEVPEGWFIEIQEPTHISLTLTTEE